MNKKTNVAIFIPHIGCPNKCSFCNQHIITGKNRNADAAYVKDTIERQIPFLAQKGFRAEIAFFGGSFTALPRDYMISLLTAAEEYAKGYPQLFYGIRCSTRPDCIDSETLSVLKEHGVTSIELGAQSMDDEVLTANRRGHTAQNVRTASHLIHEFGFELGLQMMTGLYRDSTDKCIYTSKELINLSPKTMRIYPTVIMPDTYLGELFLKGEYKTFDFEQTTELCAKLYGMFVDSGIDVIRIGLNTSAEIEKKMLGGNYHPTMGEICISRYFGQQMLKQMKKLGGNRFVVHTDKKYISRISGFKGENRKKLSEHGYEFRIVEDSGKMPFVQKVKNIGFKKE